MRLVVLSLLAGVVLSAQTLPATTFETVAIKPNTFAFESDGLRSTATRLSAGGVTVRELLASAYNLLPSQVVDAPDWADTERFDIEATFNRTNAGRLREMLQQMLADRFGLRTRREMREMRIYALRFAEDDRSMGPRLRPFTGNCELNSGCSVSIGEGAIAVTGIPWGFLHTYLTTHLNRVVVDETGITGPVELRLDWTPDPNSVRQGAETIDIFTALYEQLGLQLASIRGPVDVLVVERLSRPKPN